MGVLKMETKDLSGEGIYKEEFMKKILLMLFVLVVVVTSSVVTTAENYKYVVTASCLNVRQAPSLNASIVGGLPKGSVVSGGASNNGWTPITYNNSCKYVYSKYLAIQGGTTTVSANNTSNYTQNDLDLLARVIHAEAGSDWLTDEHQRAVGSVVLNRVADDRFPNTISGVIYQKGQYSCVSNGMINKTPSQRAINNAEYVLKHGSTIPANVVWQSQGKQGKGVWKYIQGHYFCY